MFDDIICSIRWLPIPPLHSMNFPAAPRAWRHGIPRAVEAVLRVTAQNEDCYQNHPFMAIDAPTRNSKSPLMHKIVRQTRVSRFSEPFLPQRARWPAIYALWGRSNGSLNFGLVCRGLFGPGWVDASHWNNDWTLAISISIIVSNI